MTDRFRSQYGNVGHFARSHGNDGWLLLISDYPVDALLDLQAVIRYRNDRGDLVPARLQEVQRAESDPTNAFFVKLANIDDRSAAEALKKREVWVEKEIIEQLQSTASRVPYDQFEVFNEKNDSVGKVVNGFETPAQRIMEIELEDGKQLMVPVVDEFIREVDEENERLYCRNLEMLKDI